jgi:SpoIIAA-like
MFMPASISWINPGRIIRIKLEGDVTDSDLVSFRPQLKAALDKSSTRLDYVLDVSQLTSFPETVLRFILNKQGTLRSPKTGRIAVIGVSPQQRLVLESAALALRLAIAYVETERDALAFIAEA